MKTLSFLTLSLFSLLTATAHCPSDNDAPAATPTDSLMHFVKSVNAFNYLYPQEKVYVHFDNTGYFIGESIWFKAYVVAASSLEPTAMSRVLHVELLTPEGRILNTQKLKIENGQCHGCLPLTDVLHAGFYEVRAYTRMMLNWDKELMFSRVFPIFDAPQKEDEQMYAKPTMTKFPHSQRLPQQRDKAKREEDRLRLDFFPEGGALMEGITSAVYFKATDKQGRPAEVTATVRNSQGDAVATLTTAHQGMGKFLFTPQSGETYVAEVTEEKRTQRFPLPAARSEGCVLRLEEDYDTLTVRLSRHPDTFCMPVGLAAMGSGTVSCFQSIVWDKAGECTVRIPKEVLAPGVNQLTLFDTHGRVLAERLAFVRPRNGILISYSTDKPSYGPREVIEMDFRVSDRFNAPLATTFSVSVRDAAFDTPHNRTATQAEANLLLGSDLRGFIDDIDYYFERDDKEHRAALDLLMGTQGYRRYDWQQMTRPEEFHPEHFIEEGILVKGKLRSFFLNRTKDSVDIQVTIWNAEGQAKRGTAVTDTLGNFVFQAEDFHGQWKMHIETKENGKRKEMNVYLDKEYAPKGRPLFAQEQTLYKLTESRTPFSPIVTLSPDTLLADEKATRWQNMLPLVEVNAKKRWQQYNFRRWQNMVYDMGEELRHTDDTGKEYLEYLDDWLDAHNPYYNKVSNTYRGRNVVFHYSHPLDSRVIIRGNSISIDEVDAIAISDKPANLIWLISENPQYADRYTSMIGQKPMVVITVFLNEKHFTKYGKEKLGERLSKLQGFAPERRFYMPDYSEAYLPDQKDYRRTLYWNPNVTTDEAGEATVSFYNTPTCQQMKVSAATVTPDGLMGNLEE